MIRIESIWIKDFRGIRDLTLDFRGKNFAICGPNGTGKSGVVDAIEFGLTGRVSRLEGEGRGDICLSQHGPHVDKRNDPTSAVVRITVSSALLETPLVIERSVKKPNAAVLSPKTPATLWLLSVLESQPEVVLSRRELIRYVLATPGKRAEEVQAVLRLDRVDQVRATLQKIANSCEKRSKMLGDVVKSAREQLLRVPGISEVSKEKIMEAANTRRADLGLPPVLELTGTTCLKDGLATAGSFVHSVGVPKSQALTDIVAAREALSQVTSAQTKGTTEIILETLRILAADNTFESAVAREAFYTAGDRFLVEDSCPLCDTEWDLATLRSHLTTKINHLKEVSRKRKAAEKEIIPVLTLLKKVQTSVEMVVRHATQLKPPVPCEDLIKHAAVCKQTSQVLASFLPLADTIAGLSSVPIVPDAVFRSLAFTEEAVKRLPEPTKQEAAREWLTVAEERLEVWRDAKRKHRIAENEEKLARQVYETYVSVSDKRLAELYTTVESDFTVLYRFVNEEDENKFEAQLIPSLGKLGFDVDFYGRGFFPPGAYHSEGHQDAMGLCLYLGLMKHLRGSHFTLAVLDDVVMSVDAGHRREICKLLRKEFPNTQFVITTHDPIWLRHMRTEGLVGGKSSVQFRTWSVAHGPTTWQHQDVWVEVDSNLKMNDVRGAAALLRHYLEYEATELCNRLRASVGFRADGQYQLGELLPAAISQMKSLFGRAKKAANSWNRKEVVAAINDAETGFQAAVSKTDAEKWQVNVAVHFNAWDNLTSREFAPVVQAFKDLLKAFTCIDCGCYLKVAPERETAETVRCDCRTHFELTVKG